MKKLVALLLVVGFVSFLFGCSNENSWSNIMEDISEPKTGIITDKGQLLAPIIFDSGARLETTEDSWLDRHRLKRSNQGSNY